MVQFYFHLFEEKGQPGEKLYRPPNHHTSVTSASENKRVCPQKFGGADVLMGSLGFLLSVQTA